MIQYCLTESYHKIPPIELVTGSAIAIYQDDGPLGICGQAMSTTCPHTWVYLFDSEEKLREAAANKKIGRQGKNAKIRVLVVGEWGDGAWHLKDEREGVAVDATP